MHRACQLLATAITTPSIASVLCSPRLLCSCRTFSIAGPATYSTAARRAPRSFPAFAVLRPAAPAPAALASPSISLQPVQSLPPPFRTMSSSSPPPSPPPPLEKIFFGPFDVSTQVFYTTAHSFALVNLKPLLSGHVLVCPRRPHRRITDLDPAELADLFAAVQVVQRMLAAHYFGGDRAEQTEQMGQKEGNEDEKESQVNKGSFNLAIQDGPEAGQTVPHVHVHVLPRIRGATAKDGTTEADALYEKMAEESGNVGGAQWDAAVVAAAEERLGGRPRPGGRFPRIEDSNREARTMAEMEAEAAEFRQALSNLESSSSSSSKRGQ